MTRSIFYISSSRMHILTSVLSLHWDVVLGYQLINLSSLIIKTYTYNILWPFSMTILSRWVLVSGGGGEGGRVKEMPGDY